MLCVRGTPPRSTSTPPPLLTSPSTTCLHSVVSLGSPPLPSTPPPPSYPSCPLVTPPFTHWPIEGRMRKTERTSRAPRGAACTITCTAFTCPASTAAAPATVAKLACPRRPTLSAMPPSLNTCESAGSTHCLPQVADACPSPPSSSVTQASSNAHCLRRDEIE